MEVARINVAVGANTQEFNDGMRTVDDRIRGAAQGMQRFGSTMTRNVTLPILAAGGAVGGLIVKAGQFADELLDLSATTGISTDSLQLWRRAAVEAGTDVDAFAGAVQYLHRRYIEGEEVADRFAEAVGRIGVSLYETHEDLADTTMALRDTEDIVKDMILTLADIEDPVERANKGLEAFRGRWDEIAPLVALGRDELEKILGMDPVFTREQLENMDRARQAWDVMRYHIGQASFEIAEYLIGSQDLEKFMKEDFEPTIERVTGKVKDLIDAWRDLDPEVQDIIKYAGIALVAIGPIAKIIGNIALAMLAVKNALTGPVGLTALVGVASVKLGEFYDAGFKAMGISEEWRDVLMRLVNISLPWFNLRLGDTIDRIRDAGGPLQALVDAWNRLRDAIRDAIRALRDWFNIGGGTAPGIMGGGPGAFHSGGVFRAPRLGGEGLAILKDQERVIPAGADISHLHEDKTVNNYYNVHLNIDHFSGDQRALRTLERKLAEIRFSEAQRGVAYG